MKIKAVIFDLDGTLLNTLDDLTDATNHALNAVGRNAIGISDVRGFVGNGVPKLIERALRFTAPSAVGTDGTDDGTFAATLEKFTEYYNVHNTDKTKLYDGIAELLAALSARGIKTAVVTNKYDGAAQALKIRFFPTVDFVVGTSENVRPKPARDGVDRALAALGVSADEAVYVGDGETDMLTAKNAGLPAVAVTWGFRDRTVLAGFDPYAMIDEPKALITAIDEMTGDKKA